MVMRLRAAVSVKANKLLVLCSDLVKISLKSGSEPNLTRDRI